ncbi:MAG: DNA glycosylase [Merdibacter sp.]
MLIEILDDFDLEKIALSGQCFRVKRMQDDGYRFIFGDEVLYIREIGNHRFSVSCSLDAWRNTWSFYFDLNRSYNDIFEMECDKHQFIHEAMLYGRGLRILRQDPWEMLITFIISQRKNIPAISKSIEMLASKFGHCIKTGYETLYSFPSPLEMSCATDTN